MFPYILWFVISAIGVFAGIYLALRLLNKPEERVITSFDESEAEENEKIAQRLNKRREEVEKKIKSAQKEAGKREEEKSERVPRSLPKKRKLRRHLRPKKETVASVRIATEDRAGGYASTLDFDCAMSGMEDKEFIASMQKKVDDAYSVLAKKTKK